MSNNKQITYNQHFIPRCVLRHFKESDNVYDKKQKRIYHAIHHKKGIYPSTIDDVMAVKYFYENAKFPRNSIENLLSEFEGTFSKVHDNVLELVKAYDEGNIRYSEVKAAIFDFIELLIKMHLRSGAMMYELNYWQERDRPNHSLVRMLNRLLDHRYSRDFADTLKNYYKFCIIKSYNKNFLISDQFIATCSLSFKARFMNATNRTVGLKDIMILIPLSKTYYICFFHGDKKPNYIIKDQMRDLTDEQTLIINSTIMNNSYMQTAGPNYDDLSKAIKNYRDDGPTAFYYGSEKVTGGAELSKEVFFYERDRSVFEFISFPVNYQRYQGVQKNDICPCKSGKSFGECCRFKMRELAKFMERVELSNKDKYYDPYRIPGCHFRQLNIFEYCKQMPYEGYY